MSTDEKLNALLKLRHALQLTFDAVNRAYAPHDAKLPIEIDEHDLQETFDGLCSADWYLGVARQYLQRLRED